MSVFAQLLAQYPRFADTLVPRADSQPIDLETLSEPSTVIAAIGAGQRIFQLRQPKHAGQLWFYSLCNALVAPSVTVMVEFDEVPSLDIGEGMLHRVDDFWFGFSTTARRSPGDYRGSGMAFGASMSGVVDTLCALTDLRPAPLWAVAADCLAMAAVQAGEEAFEEDLAATVATELVDGLNTRHTAPAVRFDASGHLRRASCCMIFHSPSAGMCLSCPAKV
ncbi:(2Fe-2S)-binding protein [Corynebacterium pacaense]|uniref:(2Fe-2S)-binding protein n=1 Tax=Corynebacterium pacaense TaxID=1816684 RepID=UPI0009BB1F60|nr:(2Fe-2S)-binding protein [Corynebacterium pacaense]